LLVEVIFISFWPFYFSQLIDQKHFLTFIPGLSLFLLAFQDKDYIAAIYQHFLSNV